MTDSVHCRTCGAPLEPQGLHFRCQEGHLDYNNPAPAVCGVITRDDTVLLCRRGREPNKGLWDLPGGFVEAGETGEYALARELAEELDVEAAIGDYLGALPGDYGGRPTLTLAYHADIHGVPTANDDVAEVAWFNLADLPSLAWSHEATILKGLLASHR